MMKHTRLLFTVLTVVAVTGGMLAFKAQKIGLGTVYCDKLCTIKIDYEVNTVNEGTQNPCEGFGAYVKQNGVCTHVNGWFKTVEFGDDK